MLPVAMWIFLSIPSEKKASDCPSGEKLGCTADSLPESGLGFKSPSARRNSDGWPLGKTPA